MAGSLVVFRTLSTESEAKILQAVLRAGGVPAVVEGSHLMDEWAVSQRALGQLGVEVKIPAGAEEQAEEVIARARAAGIELSEEE